MSASRRVFPEVLQQTTGFSRSSHVYNNPTFFPLKSCVCGSHSISGEKAELRNSVSLGGSNSSKFCVFRLTTVRGLSVTPKIRYPPEALANDAIVFYPPFTDAQAPRAIEVVDYDDATATALPLKVQFLQGKWVIASRYNYRVDIGDRLAKTAAALMYLKKDMVRSDSPLDHAKYGVVDPLDEKVSGLTGRGKRVTLRDANGGVLADYILGKPVEGKPGYRYVRVPGQKRTYAVT